MCGLSHIRQPNHIIFSSYERGADFIRRTTSNLQYRGGYTHTNKALDQARNEVFGQEGDRRDVINIVILVTDGIPFPHYVIQPTIDSAQTLQQIAFMFAVGITEAINPDLLALLSSQPRLVEYSYFWSPDFRLLQVLAERLIDVVASVVPTGTPRTTVGNSRR